MPQDEAQINTTSHTVKGGPVFEKNVSESAMLLDKALILLRAARDEVTRPAKTGGRELSEAITNLETACMWMNRSKFAQKPYSPLPQKTE